MTSGTLSLHPLIRLVYDSQEVTVTGLQIYTPLNYKRLCLRPHIDFPNVDRIKSIRNGISGQKNRISIACESASEFGACMRVNTEPFVAALLKIPSQVDIGIRQSCPTLLPKNSRSNVSFRFFVLAITQPETHTVIMLGRS